MKIETSRLVQLPIDSILNSTLGSWWIAFSYSKIHVGPIIILGSNHMKMTFGKNYCSIIPCEEYEDNFFKF